MGANDQFLMLACFPRWDGDKELMISEQVKKNVDAVLQIFLTKKLSKYYTNTNRKHIAKSCL